MRRLYLVLILLVALGGCGDDNKPKEPKWVPMFEVGDVAKVRTTGELVIVTRITHYDQQFRCRVYNNRSAKYPYVNQWFNHYELEYPDDHVPDKDTTDDW